MLLIHRYSTPFLTGPSLHFTSLHFTAQAFRSGVKSHWRHHLRRIHHCYSKVWAGYRSRYSDWLRDGRSGDRIPVGERFSAPVQIGPGIHPAFCTIGTGAFLGVKSGRGVTLSLHPLLVPWSWKGRAIPLLPLWAVRPVQSLSACTRGALYLFFAVKCSALRGKKYKEKTTVRSTPPRKCRLGITKLIT